jgi:hypothetical protein
MSSSLVLFVIPYGLCLTMSPLVFDSKKKKNQKEKFWVLIQTRFVTAVLYRSYKLFLRITSLTV